jgi:signal peptidase I
MWLTTCVVVVLAVVGATTAVAWHQGYRIYVVHTGSMSPGLRPGDAVLVAPAPDPPRPGDVVSFAVHSGPDSVVTHRVVAVVDGRVSTKGDANRTADPWTLSLSQIVGRAVATLPWAGYVLVYLRQPQGLASMAVLLLGLVLLWQLFFPPGQAGSPVAGLPPGDDPAAGAGLSRGG